MEPAMPSSSGARIVPRSLCISYRPPVIALEYQDWKHEGKRRWKRFQVPLTGSSPAEIARRLSTENPAYLGPALVREAQLVRLVEKLASGPGGTAMPVKVDETVDLRKADDATLNRHKAVMDQTFQAHRLKPGDPGYSYDKRADFAASEPNEWDEEAFDEADEMLF